MVDQPTKHPVWIEDDTTGFVVHESSPGAYAVEVQATSAEVIRWQVARQTWLATQAEMKARYDESVAIEVAVDEIEDDLAHQEWEKQRQDSQALAAIAEHEAEVEHGPRQWVLVDLRKESNPHGWRSRLTTYARRVHHKDCPTYRKTEAAIEAGESQAATSAGGLLGEYVRTPEARAWLAQSERLGSPKTTACKRCATTLQEA